VTADYNPRSTRPNSSGPDVGYKRPPVANQFKKGKSGNPNGRPKTKQQTNVPSAPSLEGLILAEAYRIIEIRENGKVEKIPMIQAVLRSTGLSAAKGNHRAQAKIVDLIQSVEERRGLQAQRMFEAIVEYKEHWKAAFAEYDRRGEPRPDVVPHPDDLAINARTGQVLYNGPFDDAERAIWDRILSTKADAEKEIVRLKRYAKRPGANKKLIDDNIRSEQRTIDRFNALLPDEETRRQPDFDIWAWRKKQQKILDIMEGLHVKRDRSGLSRK